MFQLNQIEEAGLYTKSGLALLRGDGGDGVAMGSGKPYRSC